MSQHERLWLTSVSCMTDQHQWFEYKTTWKITINQCIKHQFWCSKADFLTCNLAADVGFLPQDQEWQCHLRHLHFLAPLEVICSSWGAGWFFSIFYLYPHWFGIDTGFFQEKQNNSRKNKITINLCDDGTPQLPEFVSWQCTAADGFIFIF